LSKILQREVFLMELVLG